MNRYCKQFLLRGVFFGGFGPIIVGIVYLILELTLPAFSLSGTEAFLAIISTYLLAFVHAGASIFNQIESWPIAKSTGIHFLVLFSTYSLCYLLNRWIPFEPMVLLIFAGAFILTYAIIWLTVVLVIKKTTRHLNEKLQKQKEA